MRYPLIEVDVEIVERDMRGGYQDIFDGGIDPLKHGEIKHLCTALVEIRGQLPAVVRHGLHATSLDPEKWPQRRLDPKISRYLGNIRISSGFVKGFSLPAAAQSGAVEGRDSRDGEEGEREREIICRLCLVRL